MPFHDSHWPNNQTSYNKSINRVLKQALRYLQNRGLLRSVRTKSTEVALTVILPRRCTSRGCCPAELHPMPGCCLSRRPSGVSWAPCQPASSAPSLKPQVTAPPFLLLAKKYNVTQNLKSRLFFLILRFDYYRYLAAKMKPCSGIVRDSFLWRVWRFSQSWGSVVNPLILCSVYWESIRCTVN